jgi:predicted transcriptional regulator
MKNQKDIDDTIKELWSSKNNVEIAEILGISETSVRRYAKKLHLPERNLQIKKQGLEIRGDHIVINWTTQTVVTDLGEYGNFVCSFDMHKAVQRAYSNEYEGKGDTASEIATRFDFPHAKAVYKYAKAHGFTKSSIGQTDIEFEMGLTVEEAVEENIQALKRKTYKATEQAKWKQIQEWADNWINFHHTVLKSIENHIDQSLPKYKPPTLNLKEKKSDHVAVLGVSDVHYMKFCFDSLGKPTYNKEIAIKKLKEAVEELLLKTLKHGVPKTIYMPVGSDNIHVDNHLHQTTAGTSQVAQTDGHWILELKNYFDFTINLIDMLSQVAPVVVIPTAGNHDKHTSYALNATLSLLYKDSKKVSVIENYHEIVFVGYERTCMVFLHGDYLSEKKIQSNAHKIIMQAMKEQNVKAGAFDYYIIFSQHLHADTFKDLGANVSHVIFPSLSGTDSWHRNNAYFSEQQASMYLISGKYGKEAIFYS